MIDPKDFIGVLGVPLIVALVELTKGLLPGLQARFYPVLALVWGEALNAVLAWLLGSDIYLALFSGFVAGLIASGLFQYGKSREIRSEYDHWYDAARRIEPHG